MKAKGLILAAVAGFSLAGAQAVEVNFDGHFRLRHENYDIYQGRKDKSDATQVRVRTGLEFKLENGRKIYLAPQAVKPFGKPDDGKKTSGDANHTQVDFFEAYAEVPMGEVQLKLGRQSMHYGEGVVIGSRGWTAAGQSFDAFKLSAPVGKGELDLVYSKIESKDDATVSDDVTLSLLYYKVLREKNLEFDLYALLNNEAIESQTPDSRSYGFRYKQKFNNFGLLTENVFQDLSRQERDEYHLNLVLSYDLGKVTPFATYRAASENYQQLYANRHGFHGLIDIVGRRNLLAASVGANWRIADQWGLKAELLQFKKKSDDHLAWDQAVSQKLIGDIKEDDLGTELDLVLSYKPNKGEALELGYMTFKHGDYFARQKTSNFGYLQYTLTF